MRRIILLLGLLFCTKTYGCTTNNSSANLDDNWENININTEQKNKEVTLESLQIEVSGLILKIITPKLDDANIPLYEDLKRFSDALREMANCYQHGSRGFTSYNKNLMDQHKAQMLPSIAAKIQGLKKIVEKQNTEK